MTISDFQVNFLFQKLSKYFYFFIEDYYFFCYCNFLKTLLLKAFQFFDSLIYNLCSPITNIFYENVLFTTQLSYHLIWKSLKNSWRYLIFRVSVCSMQEHSQNHMLAMPWNCVHIAQNQTVKWWQLNCWCAKIGSSISSDKVSAAPSTQYLIRTEIFTFYG